jgi:hypothetical protein
MTEPHVTDIIHEQLRGLASALTVLHERVRTAVAGEISRAVAEAVGEVLALALGRRRASTSWARPPDPYGRDGWDDPDDWYRADGQRWAQHGAPANSDDQDKPNNGFGLSLDPKTMAALVLAVTAGRWWRSRHGTTWGAFGIGMAVIGTAFGGGPLAQAALGVFWAAHRLLAATDALGDGARTLGRL